MTHSINSPWSISDKYRQRYGELWADLDFEVAEKISEEVFKTDPMNTLIGELCIYKQRIKMTYKDLINYSKSLNILMNEAYVSGTKNDTFDVRVKSQTFTLRRHELRKLSETLMDASSAAIRAYELGLYL